MSFYKKACTALFLFFMIIISLSPLLAYVFKKPVIVAAVSSWSMEPVVTRGDLIFIWPTGDNYSYTEGQVIIFRPGDSDTDRWVMHRIVGGDAERGFTTRGDASSRTDQDNRFPPIKPEWIAGVPLSIGTYIFKIPYLGNLMLYFGENLQNPFLLTVFLSVLALLILWKPK
jgi:signal peptidase I